MSNPTGNALRAAGWIDEAGHVHPSKWRQIAIEIRKFLNIIFGQ